MLDSTNKDNSSFIHNEIQSKRNKDSWRWNITRCFPAFQGGYNKHMELADTVAASRVMGVNRFVFYVESAGPAVLRMLKMLEKEGIAEVYPWNMHLYQGDLYYMAQFSAIQECLYRHLWSSRYLLFGDVDELFVPRKHLSLMPLIQPLFEQKPECGAFLFLHTTYNCRVATQSPPRNVDPSGFAIRHRLNSLTHVLREDKLWRPNDRSKPVLDPHKVSVGSVHVVGKMRTGFKQCTIQREDAFLHHYRCFGPLPPERQLHDPYLWQVGPAIIQQVKTFMEKYNNTVIEQYP
ncbi:hypothetical protein V1264_010002 [Littorina saxatilis]|uniref:Glycosyltransferase family 92 protein n=2 Tax=Littorina saxatilis TaxID=31220 RepID=A0AAN9G041_9CAEN